VLPSDCEPVAERGPTFRIPVRVVPVLRLHSCSHPVRLLPRVVVSAPAGWGCPTSAGSLRRYAPRLLLL
jgi:hypothetical protein